MMHQKRITGFLTFLVCGLLLAGCAEQGTSSDKAYGTKADSVSASAVEENSAEDQEGQKEDATLYIGEPDHLKEVSVPKARTAKELLAALSKETGWDLTLAKPVTDGKRPDTKTVAFAATSAIYDAPPDPQKDSYHVYDSEEYVLTVLNSVSETLCNNLNLEGVFFTAPDGGVLTLENNGYDFGYPNNFEWNYASAKKTNTPLPPDDMGKMFAAPYLQNNVIGGTISLTILFQRPNIQIGTGNITVYNEDGAVSETISVRDSKKVKIVDMSDDDRNFIGGRQGTCVKIYPAKDFEAGKKYSVKLDAGAFTAAGGLKSQEISDWSFGCSNLEVSVTPKLGHEPVVKVGKPITYHFQFPDNVTRITVKKPNNHQDYSYSVKELTSDGDIIFTPKRTGKMSWGMTVEFKDEYTSEITETLTVTK